jgi:type I restriction enzyme R subunit
MLAAQPDLDDEYHRRFTRAFMEYLDRGYGACELRDPQAANAVVSALRHFDGDCYQLGDLVIMQTTSTCSSVC